ncbi:MAG TPA: nucleoside-diphosphate sugar epimerase [Planctomycetes bacterium]|nr:nucleoside-diphosphate sugar epimerase [Planctomycetota bacterium]
METAGERPQPRIWLVLGDKLGDNAQVRRVARALGRPFEEKNLVFLPKFRQGKPTFRPSLDHVDREASDPLEPPWPDLILTSGSRPSMVALWIKQRSRGKTRLAIIGRPKRMLNRFDLAVVPSQYIMPISPRVLPLDFPLMEVDRSRLEAARAAWADRLSRMPRPLTAVLVGGPTQPFRMDENVAQDLAQRLSRLIAQDGGSLYITTSRRTPSEVVSALGRSLPASSELFMWGPESADNPYLGLLAHADRFVVTGDSVSMLVEVARLGRPLAIYELPVRAGSWKRRLAAGLQKPPWRSISSFFRRFCGLDLLGFPRDITRIHRKLERRGAAVAFGEPFPLGGAGLEDELEVVVDRVRELLAADGPAEQESSQ